MCLGIQGQTASTFKLIIWRVRLLRTLFWGFFSAPSCLDEAGTRPIQACTEHTAGACGAEAASSASKPLEQSLLKDGAYACSWNKSVCSAPTIFCYSFILTSGHTGGPSEFRYIFKWLQHLQMWQTGSLFDTKWVEMRWGGISNFFAYKMRWIMEGLFKIKENVTFVCLCRNHKDTKLLWKCTELCHIVWKYF